MLFKKPPSKLVCDLPEAKVLGTWIHMYTHNAKNRKRNKKIKTQIKMFNM